MITDSMVLAAAALLAGGLNRVAGGGIATLGAEDVAGVGGRTAPAQATRRSELAGGRNLGADGRPTMGPTSIWSATKVIAGIESVQMIKKGQRGRPGSWALSPADCFYSLAAA